MQTYDLRGAQGHFLIVLLVRRLEQHRFDALIKLAEIALQLLYRRPLAFSLHLLRLVFFLELLLQLPYGLESLFQLLRFHLFPTFGRQFLVLFGEFLLDLLFLLFDQEGLVFVDPSFV